MKSRRDEYAEATRTAILEAAREAFAAAGFADASLDEMTARARVTKGAVYHHFPSKRHLFLAVADQIECEIGEAMERAAAAAGGRIEDQMAAAAVAYLDACLRADVSRIIRKEAPSALGPEVLREVERRHVLERVERGLSAEIEAGLIEAQPIEPLARALLATLREIAAYVEDSPEREGAKREGLALFARLVAGLAPKG